MAYKKLDLPATVIRKVNGKNYRINGTLMSINESAGTCTMKFNNRISRNVPVSEVYLNENLIDDIKSAGKKVWHTIKKVIKTVGGLLLPIDENGNQLTQFVNVPVNVATMKLPSSIESVYSDTVLGQASKKGLKVPQKNKNSVEDAFSEATERDIKEIEKYWSRVMKEYTKPENESVSLATTVKLVNEKYYHRVSPSSNGSKVLNEAGIPSLHNLIGGYGPEVGADELVDLIYSSIWNQLNPLSSLNPDKRLDEADTAKPLLIWGAPGIGKTAIISKAAKLLEEDGYHLGMHIIKCAALKRDDFELPDTVRNVVSLKLAVSNPKTWLPVYDPKGLTKTQLAITDAVYNSGIYKMMESNLVADAFEDHSDEEVVDIKRTEVPSVDDPDKTHSVIDTTEIFKDIQDVSLNPKIQQLLASTKQNGGIIFFDEFARLNPNVTNIMMGLMGERMYGEDFILASQWTTIAAANRLSDDLKSERDEEFRAIWDNAKQGRYQHYTYVPTKADWLEWARRSNKNTGLQNIDEKFCKFIEDSPDYVWYNALDLDAQEDIPDDVKTALSSLRPSAGKSKNKSMEQVGILTPKELDKIGRYLEDPKTRDQLSVNTWNPRTWDEVINTNMIQELRRLLNIRTREDFLKIMSPTTQTISKYGRKETYQTLNIDDNKLKEELNNLSDRKWYSWAGPKAKRVDPRNAYINTDRLGFWNQWIEKCLIADAVGSYNRPAKEWKRYHMTEKFLTDESIQAIWKNGISSKESLVKFSNQKLYQQKLPTEAWKSADTKTIRDVIHEVLHEYPGDINKDVMDDYVAIQNYKAPTATLVKRIKSEYDIELINGDKSEITDGQVVKAAKLPKHNCIFDDDILDKEQTERLAYILDNCTCAHKYALVMKWIAIFTSEAAIEVGGHDYLATTAEEIERKYFETVKSVSEDYARYIGEHSMGDAASKEILPSSVFSYIATCIKNSFVEI